MASTNKSYHYQSFGGDQSPPNVALVLSNFSCRALIFSFLNEIHNVISRLDEKSASQHAMTDARSMMGLGVDRTQDRTQDWTQDRTISTGIMPIKFSYISYISLFVWVESVIKTRFVFLFDKMINCCIFSSYSCCRQKGSSGTCAGNTISEFKQE